MDAEMEKSEYYGLLTTLAAQGKETEAGTRFKELLPVNKEDFLRSISEDVNYNFFLSLL